MRTHARRAAVLVTCAVALLAAGCGSKPKKTTTAAASTAQPLPTATKTFRIPTVPFTFSYPSNFSSVAAAQLPKGFVAILGVDRINFIDVRMTSKRALSAAALPKVVTAALKAQGVDVVDRSRTQLAGQPLFTFTAKSKAAGNATTSSLSFFTANKRTWEIGCQSDAAGAARMAVACQQALATFALHF